MSSAASSASAIATPRVTVASTSPPPLPHPPRGYIALGADGDEAAVDLALAIVDAVDQAGGMALRFAGHSRRLDA